MDFANWQQILFAVVGLVILWVVVGFVLKLARKVISLGCSLIVAAVVLYFIFRWLSAV